MIFYIPLKYPIDVSFGSLELAPWFTWKIDRDLRGSDHYPIFLFPPQPTPPIKKWPRWKLENLNWGPFRKHVQDSIRQGEIISPETFTAKVYEAAKAQIPRTSGVLHPHPVPWWNDKVKLVVIARRKALRKLRRSKEGDQTRENLLQEYHLANATAKKVIRTEKQESWRKFVGGISPSTSPTEMWRRIKALKGGRNVLSPPMIERDGQIYDDAQTVAEILVDHLAKITSDDLYNLHFRRRKQKMEYVVESAPPILDSSTERDYSIEEMMFQLDQLKGSSPGPDEIHNKMLQNLPACAKLKLLDIFNECWRSGTFPGIWKTGHAIAIPKPGKDSFDLENQRLIVLNNTPGKLFERMIARRLIDLMEERKLLDPRQFAFRRGRSTTDHLALLENLTRNAWKNKEHVEAAFVDISKAYDRTYRGLILNQLR